MSVYNEAVWIRSCVERFQDQIDELVVVDGAWRPLVVAGLVPSFASNDGTLNILRDMKLSCKLTIIDAPKDGWICHARQRAELLKYFNEGDWRYLTAPDEIAVGDVHKTFDEVRNEDKALCGYVPLVAPPNPLGLYPKNYAQVEAVIEKHKYDVIQPTLKPRFHKWQPDLWIGGEHSTFYNTNNIPREQWPRFNLKHIRHVHFNNFKRQIPNKHKYDDMMVVGPEFDPQPSPNFRPNISSKCLKVLGRGL